MKLKRIRIFGFKTFADKTEFSFEGNVIAVVGPNGCGKSNLVDAILWGLGEGNARHLRAQSSQDVIFNGSANRKGVGFAEVTLTFDNEDGTLPIDAPEVAVTRRLTRSGDNDYSINRRNCRLRDVYELLADSGLGRAGYAIVGQKEIDSALSVSAEDRRAWIDEAAGVQRYRQRKVEAFKRLSGAEDHLSRVRDILSELEAQREPLRHEATVAARYRHLQTTLRTVEVGFLVLEAKAAEAELARLEERIAISARLIRTEAVRADQAQIDAEELRAKAEKIAAQIEVTQKETQNATALKERGEAEIRLANQRLESLAEMERSLTSDREENVERVADADAERKGLNDEYLREKDRLDEIRIEAGGQDGEAKRLSSALEAAERELKAVRSQESARLKALAEREHLQERKTLALRELKSLESNLPDLEAAVLDQRKTLEELELRFLTKRTELGELEKQLSQVRADEDLDAKQVQAALAEKASLEGRQRGIEATIDTHEGVSQGSRAVLEAAERGLLKGQYIPVGRVVSAKKDLAVAIETGLGAAANDLIVEDEDDAKAAIAWLKENRAGRATFQPLTLMRPYSPPQEMERLLDSPGVLGIASELADCDVRYRPVVESLLGRVFILKTLDDALRLARASRSKSAGWSRLVTLDGELVHSGGAVTGGRQTHQAYGLVQRRADLQELERHLVQVRERVAGFNGRSQERQALTSASQEKIRSIRESQRAEESEMLEARSLLRTLEEELKSALKERGQLEKTLSQESLEPLPNPAAVPMLESKRDVALQALASKSADVEQTQVRIREARIRLDRSFAAFVSSEKRLEASRSTVDQRERRLAGIEPERDKAHQHLRRSEISVKGSTAGLEMLALQLTGLKEERQRACLEAEEKQAKSKETQESLSVLAAAMHQTELGRTRADARRSTALARLAEDYAIFGESLDAYAQGDPPPEDAPAIVQRIRREIRAMGDVNLGAIEAHDRLTARFNQLDAQRQDVEGGIEEIQKSVRELDLLTADRFNETFKLVQAAFAATFTRLFGGGEANIVLTNPDDRLDAGLELEITLPGKRRQALALLSGGERALCTAAFLFALLQVKPCPLVVLDEIDAPLDGRNVERFAEVLLETSETTQFIVITHNPVTIKSAPVWVGVSMQEPGVSHLLPVRVPESNRAVAS